MMFSQLVEHQQLMIQPAWRAQNPNAPLEDLDLLDETELWCLFLETEVDPSEVIAMYYTLFDPEYDTKMEVFDLCWQIVQHVPGFKRQYAMLLAATGRVEELSKYLKEFLDGIPKAE